MLNCGRSLNNFSSNLDVITLLPHYAFKEMEGENFAIDPVSKLSLWLLHKSVNPCFNYTSELDSFIQGKRSCEMLPQRTLSNIRLSFLRKAS